MAVSVQSTVASSLVCMPASSPSPSSSLTGEPGRRVNLFCSESAKLWTSFRGVSTSNRVSILGEPRRRGKGLVIVNVHRGGSEPGRAGPGRSGEDQAEEEVMSYEASFRNHTTDWRAFRARLIKGGEGPSLDDLQRQEQQQWAHALWKPEKGCLLIAHPAAFCSEQTYLNQAVIFLYEHDEEHGSAGFILNRPTSYAVGEVPGFDKFKPQFTLSPLYMGGDVGTNVIQVVHGIPGLSDSIQVISGVYLGGPDAVNESVKSGESLANDHRWFLGYCGWQPGELELAVSQGLWYVAAGSSDIVTNQCIRLKRPLWRQVLELMGGEYALMSRRAYGEIS